MADWLLAAAIGLVSGVLSGAFGIGGGIVTTPGIRLLIGAPALVAVGTPLPVIVPAAVTGAISYLRNGLADLRAGLVVGLAGSATSVLGAILATRAGGSVVLLGTAALIVWAAVDTILQIVRPPDGETASSESSDVPVAESAADISSPTSPPPRPSLASLVITGVITGAYSGFLGLGGGFVLVPLLTRWMRFPVKMAIGTSLIAVALLAIPGTITHALLGNIDWGIAVGLTVGVVPGAAIGSRITLGAGDRTVRIAFAVMLIAVAVWLGVNELAAVLS